jgi:hypothetical protein
MYSIRGFQKDDLLKLKMGASGKDIIDFLGVSKLGESLKANGPAYSVFFDEEPILIAGINIMWPGVGEAWAMFGGPYQDHGFFIHRQIIRSLDRLADDYKLERIQASVMKGHYAGIHWVTHLGFKFEGEMEYYFKQKTYLRYAKFYEVK